MTFLKRCCYSSLTAVLLSLPNGCKNDGSQSGGHEKPPVVHEEIGREKDSLSKYMKSIELQGEQLQLFRRLVAECSDVDARLTEFDRSTMSYHRAYDKDYAKVYAEDSVRATLYLENMKARALRFPSFNDDSSVLDVSMYYFDNTGKLIGYRNVNDEGDAGKQNLLVFIDQHTIVPNLGDESNPLGHREQGPESDSLEKVWIASETQNLRALMRNFTAIKYSLPDTENPIFAR
jgi:hypothetical protein